MDETHRKAMEAHGEMNSDMEKLHEEIMQAHKDLSPEDAKKMHKMMEQIHHPHGSCHENEAQDHESFVKKIDEMDTKLDKIMKALTVE